MDSITRILELIKENEISANRLATDLKLPSGIISEWKKKKYNPSTEAIIKIADYFDVTTDYLLGRTDKRYAQLTAALAARLEENVNNPGKILIEMDEQDYKLFQQMKTSK